MFFSQLSGQTRRSLLRPLDPHVLRERLTFAGVDLRPVGMAADTQSGGLPSSLLGQVSTGRGGKQELHLETLQRIRILTWEDGKNLPPHTHFPPASLGTLPSQQGCQTGYRKQQCALSSSYPSVGLLPLATVWQIVNIFRSGAFPLSISCTNLPEWLAHPGTQSVFVTQITLVSAVVPELLWGS